MATVEIASACVCRTMIYHMMPMPEWEAVQTQALYRTDSLEEEGFIHCTGERAQMVWVANQFYRHIPGPFVILSIDEARVQADVVWEAADDHLFPHIYGPLNLDAVVHVLGFPRSADGDFVMPDGWRTGSDDWGGANR
jgi:uncharacterized protein (DUF952 family)